ncbi:antigen 5 like allergen Cul n 1-like [Wyeomyia smithii]|uniref:antigen 5 like allergen Cul n 1-like n=1 Tax=Wyeomyia smithii TaxID=174621 RepID=UPI0024682296|nr:antigen 5 like allergen Cul n 1-like [Wyeomyia smithii]
MDSAIHYRIIKNPSSLQRLGRSIWVLLTLMVIWDQTSANYVRYEYYTDGEESIVESSTSTDGTTLLMSLPETTLVEQEEEEKGNSQISTTDSVDVVSSENDDYYCREDLCSQYDQTGQLVRKQHVACGHDGSFAADCPPGRTLFKIDSQLRAFLIHLHNEARNRLANGSMEGFEAASRMPTVVWNDELAVLAELNAKSCQFKHDECRNTELYRQAGQNLAIGYYPVEENLFDILQKLTTLWFDEYRLANQTLMDTFMSPPNVTIGHFTQMISDRTTAIGCGIVIYPQKVAGYTFKVVLYACNYSITSIYSQPVYRKGPVGAGCVAGMNPLYGGLCSEEENQLIRSVPFYE